MDVLDHTVGKMKYNLVGGCDSVHSYMWHLHSHCIMLHSLIHHSHADLLKILSVCLLHTLEFIFPSYFSLA